MQHLAVVKSQTVQPARSYLSQVSRLGFREVKECAQGHTGSVKRMQSSTQFSSSSWSTYYVPSKTDLVPAVGEPSTPHSRLLRRSVTTHPNPSCAAWLSHPPLGPRTKCRKLGPHPTSEPSDASTQDLRRCPEPGWPL